MSEFYKEISKYYKDIFPVNNAKVNFLIQSLDHISIEDAIALDIAAGSGEVAQGLKDKFGKIIAIDLEKEMVKQAKQKGLEAYQMNMLNMDFDEKFDFLYCIGNSLCHLNSMDEVESFFKQAIALMKDHARLVVQIINYSELWSNSKDGSYLGSLPTIENKKVKFERQYFKKGERIRFHTILTSQDGNFENDELLLPILPKDLEILLKSMGLKYKFFGGFDRRKDFDAKISQALVVEIMK